MKPKVWKRQVNSRGGDRSRSWGLAPIDYVFNKLFSFFLFPLCLSCSRGGVKLGIVKPELTINLLYVVWEVQVISTTPPMALVIEVFDATRCRIRVGLIDDDEYSIIIAILFYYYCSQAPQSCEMLTWIIQ